MNKEEILKKDLEILKFDDLLYKKLRSINIIDIEDLWKCRKVYLKENNFQIVIYIK